MVIVASAVLAQIMLLAIRDLSGNTCNLKALGPINYGGFCLLPLDTASLLCLAPRVHAEDFQHCFERAIVAIVDGKGKHWQTIICDSDKHGCVLVTVANHEAFSRVWGFQVQQLSASMEVD